MLNQIKSLTNSKSFMRYFKNTSWLFLERIFKMSIGFFVIIYLSRYLGVERFGLLSYSQSFVSIFMAFASLGLSSITIRELVKASYSQNILLGTTFSLTFFSSLLSIFIIFLLNIFFIEESRSTNLIIIISFSIIFQNLNIVIDNYFQYKVLSKYVVYISFIGSIISSLLKLLLIYIEADLIYFAYSLLFDSIILSLGFLFIYKKQKLSIFKWEFDFTLAKSMLKGGWPLTFVAVSAFLYTRVDQLMINSMLGASAVGSYAAAIKINELFYFIPAIIVASLYPKLVSSKEESEENYLFLLEKVYKTVVWMTFPISITLFIFSDTIIIMLYGEEYSKAGDILSILSWGLIFIAINSVFVKILYIEHYEKKYLYKSLFGVVINIVLNYYLIQEYGVNGAAIATIVTLFCINYLYDIFDADIRRFYYLKFKCFLPK